MTNSVERLAAHVEAMKSNIDQSTVSRLMSLSRQVIEETKKKDQYPVLNLFCDWSAHPRLDRKDAQKVLAALEEALREEMEMPGRFTADTFTAIVSPRRLRNDMSALLTANTIDPTIADNPRYFVPIATCLVEDISHKPLELTEANLREKMKKPVAVGKRADVIRSNPPMPTSGIYIQAPFVIATDEKGNPIA
jgi:hypothetical protein